MFVPLVKETFVCSNFHLPLSYNLNISCSDNDLFQIPDGDFFLIGDVFKDGGLLIVVVMEREVQHQPGSVTAFCG